MVRRILERHGAERVEEVPAEGYAPAPAEVPGMRLRPLIVVAGLCAAVVACDNMANQPKRLPYELPYGAHANWPALPPPHTIARDDRPVTAAAGHPGIDRARAAALQHLLRAVPQPHRRRQRHDRQRGFPAPPSYYIERLRQAPVKHFYDVITNGYGIMFPYAARVAPADRWAIAAYIRALQASASAHLGDVPPAERQSLAMSQPAMSDARNERAHRTWRLANLVALGALVLGAVASILGAVIDPAGFFRAWLCAFLLWLGVPLGALTLVLVHDLTGGRWMAAARPALNAAIATMPLAVLAGVPALIALHELYSWTHPAPSLGNTFYLNPEFFLFRYVLYAVLWNLLAGYALWAPRGEATPIAPALSWLSGIGLLVLAFSASFAAIDWILSLEPTFWSSVFPMIAGAGWFNTGLALVVLVVALSAPRPPRRAAPSPIRWPTSPRSCSPPRYSGPMSNSASS